MNVTSRTHAFETLGTVLRALLDNNNEAHPLVRTYREPFEAGVQAAYVHNNWFTPENTQQALRSIGEMLRPEALQQWLASYELEAAGGKHVAVVMAGNIPAVGFHDLMCAVLAGHTLTAKVSSDDRVLMTMLRDLLVRIEPALESRITLTDGKLQDMDAVIATGSNNTARYFEHYFGKYPHIIRKNRASVAVLSGNESEAELEGLARDVFQYFGLGCRSVSKLFIPADMPLDTLFNAFYSQRSVIDNNKYANNYDYTRAIWLMERVEFRDNGFFLLKEDKAISSPVATAFYERYNAPDEVLDRLSAERENIQCIVSQSDVPFGTAQTPGPADYADGVDTLRWLIELS